MTDLNKILEKAKELEAKMKESQKNIKKIKAEGISGSNSVKVTLDGEGEMLKVELSDDIMKEEKAIREDAYQRSRAVSFGKTIEHYVPFMEDFPINPRDIRFFGNPIDYIAFTDMGSKNKVNDEEN